MTVPVRQLRAFNNTELSAMFRRLAKCHMGIMYGVGAEYNTATRATRYACLAFAIAIKLPDPIDEKAVGIVDAVNAAYSLYYSVIDGTRLPAPREGGITYREIARND